MNLARSAGWIAFAGCLALTGCGGAEDGTADDIINTTPTSLAEANAEMDKIDRIMAESGSTPELVEKQRLIRDRIDAFSGLVDRIDIAPGHSINFFVGSEGEVVVNERMRVGERSAMEGTSPESIAAIYERLAPGRAIPAALENLPALEVGDASEGPSLEGTLAGADNTFSADGIGTERSGLSDSAADGLWFFNNHCSIKPGGSVVFRSCVIDKVGGRFAQASADHNQVSVAFTRGTGSIFLRRRASEGGPIEQDVRILVGELHWVAWWGGWKNVRDSGCLPAPFACGTHREAQRSFKRWSVEQASGQKYDMSAIFYNKPLSWNGP
jgi:hypothetical protein